MERRDVIEHFARQADEYDRLMARLVPQFLEQGAIIRELFPRDDKPHQVLDLGCGNGILSELVLSTLPNAHVVAFDVTAEMLAACGRRLSAYPGRYDLVEGDFSTDDIGTGYDIVVAGLSLHHLAWEERREFYRRIFASMSRSGLFLARDIIIDEDLDVRRTQYDLWKAFMRSRGEDPDLWFGKHRQKDHPVTLSDHLAWLRQAGFTGVGCHWRHCNFAITTAWKK